MSSWARLIFVSIVEPIALSLWGAIYLGYQHSSYAIVLMWGVACIVYLLWWSRMFFLSMLQRPQKTLMERTTLVVMIIAITTGLCIGADLLVFSLVDAVAM